MVENPLSQYLSGEEGERTEFKQAEVIVNTTDERRREIARQLVALANRYGGKLIFGVTDDGEVEGTNLDPDLSVQKISTIASMKCSPPINFSWEFYSNQGAQDGDVFVVDIQQRESLPHAMVERTGGEIKNREYRLRVGNETRLVDDVQLRWLFRETTDPRLEYSCETWLSYGRDSIRAAPRYELPDALWRFVPFYDGVTDDDEDYLLEDEDRATRFFVELSPFAMLEQFNWVYSHSWNTERIEREGQISFQPDTDVDGRELDVEDLNVTIPDESIFAKLSMDPLDTLNERPFGFSVPPESEVSLEISCENNRSTSFLRIEKSDTFDFELEFSRTRWSVGPPHGHPIRHKYYGIDAYDRERAEQLEEQVASVSIEIIFEGDFYVFDQSDELFEEYYSYGEGVIEILESHWDNSLLVEELPDPKMYEIEDKLDRLLQASIISSDDSTEE